MSKLCQVLLAILLGCPGTPTSPVDQGFIKIDGITVSWHPVDFPLFVKLDQSMPPHILGSVQKALAHWEDSVGSPIFQTELVPSDDLAFSFPETRTVAIYAGDPGYQDGWRLGGSAELFRRTSPKSRLGSVIVTIGNQLDAEEAYSVAVHEIGHALGLAHDLNLRSSIMYPTSRAHRTQQITEKDLQAIRTLVEGSY